MAADDLALFGECWRGGEGVAGLEGKAIAEYPGVAQGASCEGDSVNPSAADHVEAVLGGEQIAASDDWCIVGVAFYAGEEVPITRACVSLFDTATVDNESGDAVFQSAIDDGEDGVFAFGGVVDASAEFDRDGFFPFDGFDDAIDDLDCGGGPTEETASVATVEDFWSGAAEVDIDDIVTGGRKEAGGFCAFGRLVSHDLGADGVIVFFDGEESSLPSAAMRDGAIEDDLVDGVGGTEVTGYPSHGEVAEAGQGGECKGVLDLDGADAQHERGSCSERISRTRSVTVEAESSGATSIHRVVVNLRNHVR